MYPPPLRCKQVPTIRAGMLQRSQSDWRELADVAMLAQFGADAQRLSKQRLERMLHSFELMCGMEEEQQEARQVGTGLLDGCGWLTLV